MPVAKPLKVGIVGAGWVATDRHLPAYLRTPGVEVIAISDRHIARAQSLARVAGGATFATESLSELLALTPDLVSICTPPFAHRDAALQALEAGVAVFMEKPMAMNTAEAQEIAAAAATSGALLCISHNFLFSRSMRRLDRVLASEETGAVRSVLAMQASSPRRRLPDWYGALPGGLFFDESPHLLYLMRHILGDFTLVAAHASRASNQSQQPFSTIQAIFDSATAPATLSMTFDAPISEWYLLVTCERRVVLVDLFRDISIVLSPDGAHRAHEILKTSLVAGAQHLGGVLSTGARIAGKRQSWGHQQLIGEVVEAVRSKGRSPVPVADSLHVMQVMDDIVAAIH